MISVRLGKNGKYWQAKWTDRLGEQHGKGLGSIDLISRKEAKELAADLQMRINTGAVQHCKAPALGDYLKRYLSLRTDLDEASMVNQRLVVELLTLKFGEAAKMDKILRPQALDFQAI